MDVLKKQILSRSIVYALLNHEKFPYFNVIDDSIYNSMAKLGYYDNISMCNYVASVSNICNDFIVCSVGGGSNGILIEIVSIDTKKIKDDELYMMIVNTFINTIFQNSSKDYVSYLKSFCNNKENFNKFIETCIEFGYVVANSKINKKINLEEQHQEFVKHCSTQTKHSELKFFTKLVTYECCENKEHFEDNGYYEDNYYEDDYYEDDYYEDGYDSVS